MNYSELSTAIQAYTENTSSTFVAEIPTFVQQAEQRIYNTVQFPSLRKNVVGVVQGTPTPNKYLAAPDDFLAVYSMAIITDYGTAAESYEYLLNKDVNFIRQSYPNPTTDVGAPRYYAQFQPYTYLIGPTPDANYQTELHYYYYPESIVTASTTLLGDNFDSVLLYGSLVEAYTYMKGEADIMAFYNTKYQEALALAKRLGDGMERQDAYRSGQFRQAVT